MQRGTGGMATALLRAAGAILGLMLVSLVWTGPEESPRLAEAAFPGANGKIAFVSDRDGNSEIYVMNADGTNQTRITSNPARDQHPAWSPDGTKIAFARDYDIYVMNADGSNQVRLTSSGPGPDRPAWSPDGTKIVFSVSAAMDSDIYVMNADGSNQARLTSGPGYDVEPVWSPGGAKIAFSRRIDSDTAGWPLFLMNAGGTNQVRLTGGPQRFQTQPDWSPDGTKITFVAREYRSPMWIAVINSDGTNRTTLTEASYNTDSPVWSPDGTRIAFSFARHLNAPPPSEYHINPQIYVMHADGTSQTRLTNNQANDTSPDWQPLQLRPTSTPTLSATATPTPTAQETSSPTPTATASAIVPSQACSPRPPVRLAAEPTGDGRLRVTVRAGQGALLSVGFGVGGRLLANAAVDVAGGPQGLGSGAVHRLPTGATAVTFVVRRLAPGAATVPLTVVDGCGAWDTFVGGGSGAF